METLFQKKSESLKDYIARIWKELNYVDNPQDESILLAIFFGLDESGKLYCSIYKTIKTLLDFFDQAAI